MCSMLMIVMVVVVLLHMCDARLWLLMLLSRWLLLLQLKRCLLLLATATAVWRMVSLTSSRRDRCGCSTEMMSVLLVMLLFLLMVLGRRRQRRQRHRRTGVAGVHRCGGCRQATTTGRSATGRHARRGGHNCGGRSSAVYLVRIGEEIWWSHHVQRHDGVLN